MSCDRCVQGEVGDIYASGGAGVGSEAPEPCPYCSEGTKARRIVELEAERDSLQLRLNSALRHRDVWTGNADLATKLVDVTTERGRLMDENQRLREALELCKALLQEDT